MAQTSTKCPRCQMPMTAEVQQVFDLHQDPDDKERLLSGQYNLAVCPSCGYQGVLAIPVVYHDPEKELLLTYVPSELGLPMDEQEKVLGPLVNQVIGRLPDEMKKGYLLRPQAMYTLNTLIDKVLEADGITKEMLAEQEKKLDILKKLVTAEEGEIKTIIAEEIDRLDENFFALFSNLQQHAMQLRDNNTMRRLQIIQTELMTETPYGRELHAMTLSTQKALADIQALGDRLSKDSLAELVLQSPDETYLRTLCSVAHNGMDYEFFVKMAARIDEAEGEVKEHYEGLREKLLEFNKGIDEAIAEETKLKKNALEQILKADDIVNGITQAARLIDENFITVARNELADARKAGDLARSGKIQQILDRIQEMQKDSEVIMFLEALLGTHNDEEMKTLTEKHPDLINDDLREMVGRLQSQALNDPAISAEMRAKIDSIAKLIAE